MEEEITWDSLLCSAGTLRRQCDTCLELSGLSYTCTQEQKTLSLP